MNYDQYFVLLADCSEAYTLQLVGTISYLELTEVQRNAYGLNRSRYVD